MAFVFSSYFGTRSREFVYPEEGDSPCDPTGISRKNGSCLVGCGEDGTLLVWKCEWMIAPDGHRIPEPIETAALPLTTLMTDEMYEGETVGKVMGVVYTQNEGEPLEIFAAVQIGCDNLLILTSQLRECNDSDGQRPFGNILSVCLPLDGVNACAEGVWHPHLPLVAKIRSNMLNVTAEKNEGSSSRRKWGQVLVATYSRDPKVPFWLPSVKPAAIHNCDNEGVKVLQVEWMSDWCGAEENPPVLILILTGGKVEACELTMLAWSGDLLPQTVKLGLKHPITLQGTVPSFLGLDSSSRSNIADSISSSSSESHQFSVVVADIKMDPTTGLGLILQHSDQKALISGFARHQTTGAMLSAEESGVLKVGDHITAIDGVDLHETTPSITAETVAAIRAEGKRYVQVHVRRNMKENFSLEASERVKESMPPSFLRGCSFSGQGGNLQSLSGQHPSQNIIADETNGLKGLSKMSWKHHLVSDSDTASIGDHSVLPSYMSLSSLPIPWSERCTLFLCFGVGSERKGVSAWEASLDSRRDSTTLRLHKLCCCSMPGASTTEILNAKPMAVGHMSDNSEISAPSLVGLCGDGWVRCWSVMLARKGAISVALSWRDRDSYSVENITFELHSWDLFEVSLPPSSFLERSILRSSENIIIRTKETTQEETDADEWKESISFFPFGGVSPIEDSASSVSGWKGPHSRFVWPKQQWIKLTQQQLDLVPEVFHSRSTLSLLYAWCNEGRKKASGLLATMDSLKEVDQHLANAILEESDLEVIEDGCAIARVQQIAWKLRSGAERRESTVISSAGVLAALLSPVSHQSCLASSACTYTDVALSMIPLWLRDETRLLSITEVIAATAFRETRDIFGLTAILYAALGKGNSTLKNLAKAEALSAVSSEQPSPGKRLLSLLSHDLTSSDGRDVASKNGFALLSKRQFHAAAAVFLLPDPPLLTEAVQTVTVHVKDRQLALLISRLVDSRKDNACDIHTHNCMVGLNTQRLILDDLLPDVYQRKDTYLEAAYLTLLGETRRATLALCRGIAFEGNDCVPPDLRAEETYDALGLVAWPIVFAALCKKDAEKVTKEDHGTDISSFACAAFLWWGEALLANNCEAACLDAVAKAIHTGDILKSEGQLGSREEKHFAPSHIPSKPYMLNRIDATPAQQPSQLEESSVDIFAGYDTAPSRQLQLPVTRSVAPIDIFAAYDVPSLSTSTQQPLTRQNENDRGCCSSTSRHTRVSASTVLLDETMRSYDTNVLGQWAFQDEKTIAIAQLATSTWSSELSIRALGKLIAKETCLMLGCREGCGRGSIFTRPMDMLTMTRKVHSGILPELNARISSLLETARESIPEISRNAVLGSAILSIKPYICDCRFHRNDICFERLPAWALLLSLAEKGGCSAAVCRASRRLLQICDMPYSERGPEREALVAGAWNEGCALEMVIALHVTNNIILSSRAVLDGVLGFKAALILYASQRKEFGVARALINCPQSNPQTNELDSVGLEVEDQFDGLPVKSRNHEAPWVLSSTSSPSRVELLGEEAGAAYFSSSQLSGKQQAEAFLEVFAPGSCILRDGRCVETGEGEGRNFLISFSVVINRGVIRHGVISAKIVAVEGNREGCHEFHCGSIGPFDSMPKLLRQISHVLPCGLMLSLHLDVQSKCSSVSNLPQPLWESLQNMSSPNKGLMEELSLGKSWLPDPDMAACAMHSTCPDLVDALESIWLYRVHKILHDCVADLVQRTECETVVPLSARVCGYRRPFVTEEEVDRGDSWKAPGHLKGSCRSCTLYEDVFYPLYLWAIRLDRGFCSKALSLEGQEGSFVSPPLTSIDLEAKLIESGLDNKIIQYAAQPDGRRCYIARCFSKIQLEEFLGSDSVKSEEHASLESMKAVGAIRAACISPGRGKGGMPRHGGKALDEEILVVVNRWEVEPVHGGSGGGGVMRFGSLGRTVFAPTAGDKSLYMLEDQCRELASCAGGAAALLWKELRCLQWLARIPSRFLMQRAGHHTLCSLGGTVNASALLSCLIGRSCRNAGLRRLSFPNRSIPLIRVEMVDLKNLAQYRATRAIDVYAILRLSSHDEMLEDSRGLSTETQHECSWQPPGTLVTDVQRINPSGHAKATRQWCGAAVFRLALPMPEEDPTVFYPLVCSQKEYIRLQQAKEGLKTPLDAPPRTLHVAVFRHALMGDHCIGTGIIYLDDLDDSSPIEEWLPLKGVPRHSPPGRSPAWFINLRITLRFVAMHLADHTETSTAMAKTRFEGSVCQLSDVRTSARHENVEVKAFREGTSFL